MNVKEFSQDILEGKVGYDDAIDILENSPALYNNKFIPFSLLPVIYSYADKEKLEKCVSAFTAVLAKLLKAFCKNQNLRNLFYFNDFQKKLFEPYFNLSEQALDFAISDSLAFLRYDTLYDKNSGEVKICEINSNALGGIAESYFTQKALESLCITSNHLNISELHRFNGQIYENFANAILSKIQYIENTRSVQGAQKLGSVSSKGKRNLSFLVIFDSECPNYLELAYFANFFEKNNINVSVVDARNILVASDGSIVADKVYYGKAGEKIDYIYNYLIYSDVAKYHLDDLLCSLAGNTSFFPCPLCFLLQDKQLLSVLTHLVSETPDRAFSDILDAGDKACIRKYLSETYTVKNGFVDKEKLEEITKSREDYILKDTSLYGGANVLFGKDISESQWNKKVREAYSSDSSLSVAQKVCKFSKIEILPIYPDYEKNKRLNIINANAVLGLFTLNQKFSGLYIRSGISNVVSSAKSSIVASPFYMEKL